MKVTLSLKNYDRMIKTLNLANTTVKQQLIDGLVDNGKKLRDRARKVLDEESASRTNKRYWTGNLHEAIESRVMIREDNVAGISVGVDMRKAPYAEWVEIGHYLVAGSFGSDRGDWWEGYHYLERAFLEVGQDIPNQIANTLKVTLRNFDVRKTGFAHKTTGRFVKGSAGFNIE